MEGLLIAEVLGRLRSSLPTPRSAWAFPDDGTAALPLAAGASLWLHAGPSDPRLELRDAEVPRAGPRTPFQRQLAARATGELVVAEQVALDRVVKLAFGPSRGFVPAPPVTLVAELTGRNANLVLVGEDGRVVGAMRAVTAERNRFREVRPGAPYVLPPPYDKLDPRSATDAELERRLAGLEVARVRAHVDGVGPRLQAALESRLAAEAGSTPDTRLEGELLRRAVEALRAMAARPAAFLEEHGAAPGDARRGLAADSERREVTKRLSDGLRLARRRLADAERSAASDEELSRLRAEADLLLAAAGSWRASGSRATVTGYDGESVELEIDPRRDAAGNAQLRYDRARRREARAARAREQLPALRAEVTRLEAQLASVDGATDDELRRLRRQLEVEGSARSAGRGKAPTRSAPGLRIIDPRGFEVVVGRNARENHAVTFEVARSRDVWLHAQGYRGAHVVVRAAGRPVPFETVLFAARLAAGFSEARGSSNVPVDYTERKHVWRPRGAPPGAVLFTQQRTVYVEPARNEAEAEAGREER